MSDNVLINERYIPLSLYIHFPWCVRKCPYCDFNSHAIKAELPEAQYIQQLLADLEAAQPWIQGREITSIFMGGGTPSLFSPRSIKDLLSGLKSRLAFAEGIEITLEANPGTVEQEKFAGFLDASINRLSIGVQSFNPEKLKALGRIHDAAAAFNAIESAQKAGFTNFNIDLMHGLPAQTCDEALQDIAFAIEAGAPHISWYQLTLEPNTAFYHRPPVLPAEDILEDIYTAGHAYLIQEGYQHYEVSAYSQPQAQCRHNKNYWEFGDYLGIGAGAHGKITDLKTGKIIRTEKPKHPKAYLALENFTENAREVAPQQLPFEFMLNSLRLQEAMPWDLFSHRTFLDKKNLLPAMEKLAEKKLISFDAYSFEVTPLGRRFLNDVLMAFEIA